jgi:peptidoglycan/LPS O-acetylase OafA/YrhL
MGTRLRRQDRGGFRPAQRLMRFSGLRISALASTVRSARVALADTTAETGNATASAANEHQLAGIEVLRFLCAVAVLIYHYRHFMFLGPYVDADFPVIAAALPFSTALSLFYWHGHAAVDFFWAVSGLVFYHRYAELIGNGEVGVGTFALRRFARLYPLHILTLLFVAALQWAYFRGHGQYFIYDDDSLRAFAGQLLLASNWFTWQHYSFNGPIWSVSVEVLVYVCFFLIARLFGANLLVAALVALGFALIGFVGKDVLFHRTVFRCGFMFFFAGATAHGLLRHRFGPSIAGCLVIAIGVLAAARGARLLESLPFLGVLAACSLVLFGRLGAAAISAVKPLAIFGQATYSSYLLHFPVQLVAVLAFDAAGIGREVFLRPSLFLGYLVGVIALSMLSYRYFEQPLRTWMRRSAESVRWPSRGTAAVRRLRRATPLS